MPLVSQEIPSFVQGVSEQPFTLRLPSQGETVENAFLSADRGLDKRPPTQYVAELDSGGSLGNAHVHEFNRAADDQGFLILDGAGNVKVFDHDGAEATVTVAAANTNYINSVSSPKTEFRCITVADYTFIVNTTQTPAMSGATYHESSGVGYSRVLIWIRQALIHSTYTVTVYSDSTKTTTVASGTITPATAADAETENIASTIAAAINGTGATIPGGSDTNMVATTMGSLIFLDRNVGDFYVEVTDGEGNDAIILIDGSVDAPQNLPKTAEQRFQAEVIGDLSTEYDNYYVEYSDVDKAWIEIPKPGRTFTIDAATMPHVLVKTGAGAYSYDDLSLTNCPAGDAATNPEPSFIGSPINDVFFYAGRLGFITDSTCVMSQPGDIFNFWRTTVTQLLDSAPIDVEITQIDPAPLRNAWEFDNTIFISNDRAQFRLDTGGDLVSASSVRFPLASKYPMDTAAKPVVAGDRAYFTHTKGQFSAVHEYFSEPDGKGRLRYGAEEVTSQAQKFIRGSVRKIINMPSHDMLIFITDQEDNTLYAYNYSFTDRQRAQQALHKWTFDSENQIKGGDGDDSTLFLTIARGTDYVLEKIDLSMSDDPSMSIVMHLDSRLDETQVTSATYSAVTDKTTVTLPFSRDVSSSEFVLYGRGTSSNIKAGQRLATTSTAVSPVTFTVDGVDLSADDFYVGRDYTMTYKLSPIVYRSRRTGEPLTDTRLQIHRGYINHGSSGYFRVVITPSQRETFTYPFTAKTLGTSTTVIGAIPDEEGTFKFPIMANNLNVEISIINDSPFPSNLLSGGWKGLYGTV